MRRTLAVVMLALSLTLVGMPAASQAATRTCATRADYNAVRNGMSRPTVTRILHNPGRRVAAYTVLRVVRPLSVSVWRYRVCTRSTGWIAVTYVNGLVRIKSARW